MSRPDMSKRKDDIHDLLCETTKMKTIPVTECTLTGFVSSRNIFSTICSTFRSDATLDSDVWRINCQMHWSHRIRYGNTFSRSTHVLSSFGNQSNCVLDWNLLWVEYSWYNICLGRQEWIIWLLASSNWDEYCTAIGQINNVWFN